MKIIRFFDSLVYLILDGGEGGYAPAREADIFLGYILVFSKKLADHYREGRILHDLHNTETEMAGSNFHGHRLGHAGYVPDRFSRRD
jgi:hypothetical protein